MLVIATGFILMLVIPLSPEPEPSRCCMRGVPCLSLDRHQILLEIDRDFYRQPLISVREDRSLELGDGIELIDGPLNKNGKQEINEIG